MTSCEMHEPVLAIQYRDAIKEVYGCTIRVARKQYPRFAKREVELCLAGIGLKEYAVTVARLWQGWVKRLMLRCLPVNVFLGPKSAKMYAEAYPVDLTHNDADKAIILNDELTLATLCIVNNLPEHVVMPEICLSESWWAANDSGKRPIKEAAELLCKLYCIECTTTNYVSIGELFRGGKIRLESRLQRAYSSIMPQE